MDNGQVDVIVTICLIYQMGRCVVSKVPCLHLSVTCAVYVYICSTGGIDVKSIIGRVSNSGSILGRVVLKVLKEGKFLAWRSA